MGPGRAPFKCRRVGAPGAPAVSVGGLHPALQSVRDQGVRAAAAGNTPRSAAADPLRCRPPADFTQGLDRWHGGELCSEAAVRACWTIAGDLEQLCRLDVGPVIRKQQQVAGGSDVARLQRYSPAEGCHGLLKPTETSQAQPESASGTSVRATRRGADCRIRGSGWRSGRAFEDLLSPEKPVKSSSRFCIASASI